MQKPALLIAPICAKDMGDSNMEIKYRPGEKKDCVKLAKRVNIASDGVVEYLFHGLVPGMTPVQVLAHNYENDNYPCSANN